MGPRVLMFGWEFPPHNSGGLGTACQGLSRALSAIGVGTIFVLPRRTSTEEQGLRFRFAGLEKVKFRTVPGLLYPYVTEAAYQRALANLNQLVPSPYGHNLLAEVRLYGLRARQIALEEVNNFDVIHAHDWLAFPAGLMAKAATGKRLLVHVHATEYDRGGGHGVNPVVYQIEKQGMELADGVVAVSQWTKNLITRHYGIPADKVRVVHNGVSDEEPRCLISGLSHLKAAGNKIVLFVGRITLQKGPDYFVSLAKRVLDLYPSVYFVMVGSGDMLGQVVEAAARLGVADRLLFPGFLRGEELDAVYQAADLYVLPSVSEPFGITPLESLKNGTPVLVSKQSGVAEVLTHALKVDFWDIEEMANQIVSVFHHPVLQRVLADYGRMEARRLTWGEAARKCLDFYRDLVRYSSV